MAEGMPSPPTDPRPPVRWWQWILMYPTLLLALIGAIPQYREWITALILGLSPFSNVKATQEQLEAWNYNSTCLRDRGIDHIKPISQTNYGIDLLSCPSGDILVTLTPVQNPDHPVSRWVITKNLFDQTGWRSISTPALAQITRPEHDTPYPVRVVDTKQQGTTIIKRVQLSDNTCRDEMIDGLTGRQLSTTNAPCARF
jgi:hypothetical protein